MRAKFIYVIGGFILFKSISKLLGDGFQNNRQALIAGFLTSIAIGLMLYEYSSKKKPQDQN